MKTEGGGKRERERERWRWPESKRGRYFDKEEGLLQSFHFGELLD